MKFEERDAFSWLRRDSSRRHRKTPEPTNGGFRKKTVNYEVLKKLQGLSFASRTEDIAKNF